MNRLKEIEDRQAAIRADLGRIAALPEPTDAEGDEVARAQILTDRNTETDTLLAEFDTLETERGPLADREARRARVLNTISRSGAVESGDGTIGAPALVGVKDPFDADPARTTRTDAIERARYFIDGEKRVSISDENRAHLEQMVLRADDPDEDGFIQFDGSYVARRMLLTENPAYRSAWRKYMRGPGLILNAQEQAAVAAYQEFEVRRAASEGSNSAGGYGIPVIIDPTIILTSGASEVPVLQVCRVETITNNIWKGVTSAAPAWSWDAEAAEVSDDMTTLSQPSVTVYMGRGFIPYSIEVGADYPNFAEQMSKLLSQGYTDLIASSLATGSGSSQMRGVFTALDATSSSEVLVTTAGTFDAAQVFKLWNALPERFRSRASWFMNVSVESQIRQFANNANNTAYFTVDLTGDGISRINGRPVYLSDYAPAYVATTGHQNYLACGDFTGYLVAQRAGMQVEQIPMLFSTGNGRPTGQRGLFAWARTGGDVIVSNALRLLNQT